MEFATFTLIFYISTINSVTFGLRARYSRGYPRVRAEEQAVK